MMTKPDPLAPRRRAIKCLIGAACGWPPLMGASALAQAQMPGTAGAASEADLSRIGTRLVLPDVPLLDGKIFRAQEAKGQVVVLYWWASWCPFCAVQSPLMEKLWQAHRGKGLRVLGLSIDKKPGEATDYLARKGYTFASGFVTPELNRSLPKPKGLPVTVVRGRDERIVMAEAGQLFPEDIEQIARFL
jgi:thiol-disulfide isomerase/thioredoxin